MRINRAAAGLLAWLALAATSLAQGPLNPNFIVPTAPAGTSNNQAASTAFVTNAFNPAASLVVNVTAPPYNAPCNGVCNDVVAFNAALAAVAVAGGGIVTAPIGRVCIITSGNTILLQNNAYISGSFTLRGNSATNNTEMIFAGAGLFRTGVIGVTIDMLNSFVNGNLNNVAISANQVTNFLVESVNIINQGNIGIVINGGTYRIVSNSIKMTTPSGHQNQSILVACNFSSNGLIDSNFVIGSAFNVCSQHTVMSRNVITGFGYGAGIAVGSIGTPCNASTLGAPICGNTIAFNQISGGAGIDDNLDIVNGIEVYDPQAVVFGNTVWGNDGHGIQGSAANMSSNVVRDNCRYYIGHAIAGGCVGMQIRKDISGDGSNTMLAQNYVFNSFGATLTVTGAAAASGLVRLTVTSTATVGPANTVPNCQVRNVVGTTEANGGWAQCKVIDATHIDLVGSTFVNAYVSGGTIGGLQDYSYQENSSTMTGIQLIGNDFTAGFLGATDIQSAATNLAAECKASACSPASGWLLIGNGTQYTSNNVSGGLSLDLNGVATVTTNANLTGPITSVGNATSIASQTGTGTKFVVDTSPTLVTPNIGAASGISLNLTATSMAFTFNVTAGAIVQAGAILAASMGNDQKVYSVIGTAASNNNAFYHLYNHNSTAASRYWGVQAFEAGAGTGLNVFADGGAALGTTTSPGAGIFTADVGFKAGTSAGLSTTKTVRASGGAADCTLIYTGGLLTGGSCAHMGEADWSWLVGDNDNAQWRQAM